MTSGGLGVIAVEEVQAAVVGGDAQSVVAGELRIVGDDGGDKRTRAQSGEFDGPGRGVVAQEGDDGSEGLGVVYGRSAVICKAQDGGVEEGALELFAAVDYLAAAGLELLDGFCDVFLLFRGDQRAHGCVGIARVSHDDLLAQAGAEGVNGGVDKRMRNDGTTDSGTLLPRLRGHLAEYGLDEVLELRGVRRDVGAQDGGIEGVCLRAELDAAFDDIAVRAQGSGGIGRAGEGHMVAVVQVIQQVTGGTGDEL